MINPYLAVSAVIFSIGIYGLISKRNIIRILLSVEVIFNAAMLALLTVASSSQKPEIGAVTAILALTISAAEVGVTVSIAVLLFNLRGELDVYKLDKFRR